MSRTNSRSVPHRSAAPAMRLCLAAVAALIALAPFAPPPAGAEEEKEIRIGVLAYRGPEAAERMWSPTARYLAAEMPWHSFTIVPLEFDRIGPTVGAGGVDFVITNSADYVEMEALYGASRIATLKNAGNGGSFTQFGGVIFTKHGRAGIKKLDDLKGKSFMAVEKNSFGGWWMALRELKRQGIDPSSDFSSFQFGGTHDAVVRAVRDGKVDAGTVRTGILERMAREGAIDISDFHVLNLQQSKEFPLLHSTPLYPEWPLAKAKHTAAETAEKVVIALLKLNERHPAALAAGIAGWTIPLDYQPVHDCMKELGVGPYKRTESATSFDLLRAYWQWLAVAAAALVVMAGATFYALRLNRQLILSRAALERARDELELRVRERTEALERTNRELQQEVGERAAAESALRQSEQRYRDLFENANDLIQSVAPDGTFQYVNRTWRDTLGYTEEEVRRLNMADVIHPDCLDHCVEVFQKLLAGQDGARTETAFVTKDGGKIVVEGNINCSFAEGVPVATRGIFRDVTERKEMEEKLRALAERDPLTDLYNRRKFYDLLEREVQRAHRYRHPLSLILFDIDDFKTVNDTSGHAAGDAVLVAIGKIVQDCIRKTDLLARFGGEEFIVLTPETGLDGARGLAEKLRQAVGAHLFPYGQRLTVSVGIAEFRDGESSDHFIKRTDDALYAAKGGGKDRIEVSNAA